MRPTRYMVPKTETCRAIEPLRTKFSQVRFQIVCRWSPPFFGLASHTPTFLVLYLDSIRPAVMYFQNRYNRLDLSHRFFFVLVANRWPGFVDRHAGGVSFDLRDVNAEEGVQRLPLLVRFLRWIWPPQLLKAARWAGIWPMCLVVCVFDPTLVKCVIRGR